MCKILLFLIKVSFLRLFFVFDLSCRTVLSQWLFIANLIVPILRLEIPLKILSQPLYQGRFKVNIESTYGIVGLSIMQISIFNWIFSIIKCNTINIFWLWNWSVILCWQKSVIIDLRRIKKWKDYSLVTDGFLLAPIIWWKSGESVHR